jgi:arylsulfatase A-like enzyme
MFPSPFPEEVHDTTWITNLGLDYMQRRLDADDAQPFFCQISYVDPHDPYDPPKPYQDMYTPDDMPEPVAAEWEEQGPSCLREFNALNCKVIREQNPAIFRQARALYHGSIRFMDDQIARVIDFLEKRGIADHTIVVFSTDHGDMMGDHGFMAKGHPHYDGCIRSPLIVWGGGVSGGPCDQLTCALDFFPTFCEWAGVPADELPPLEGKSFAGSAQGGQDPDTWREVSLTSIGSQSVVTDDGWRLTRYLEHDQGQMFHLFDDPDEQRNLYEDGSLGDKRQELLERCIRIESRPYQIPSYRTSNPRRREIDYLQYQNDR